MLVNSQFASILRIVPVWLNFVLTAQRCTSPRRWRTCAVAVCSTCTCTESTM